MRRTGQSRSRNGTSLSAYSGHRAARHRRRLRVEPLEDRRLLAVITVQTTDDVVDLGDGVTSLREAIFAANIVPGPDTIEFDFRHDGPATILLRQGELKITDALAIHGPGAGLLTIDASGNDPTPDLHNADGSRVFHIDNGRSQQFDASISGVTLTGGDVRGLGGAILNRENLSLSEVVVAGNSAHGAFDGGGGGIFSGAGKLSIAKSTIQENYSSSYGGGIDVDRGEVAISNTIIRDNSSFYSGAGVRFTLSEAEVSQSVIRGNRGMAGGGIYNDSGNLVVRASWIAENSTGGLGTHFGGGIYNCFGTLLVVDSTISNNFGTKGAGIANASGERLATVRNSTISGNVADGAGGGIYNFTGKLVVEFSTITDNSAPENWGGGVASSGTDTGFRATTTQVYTSIISGNRSSDVDIVNGDANTFVSQGFNVIGIGNAAANFAKPSDQTGITDPLLGPLANNEGPTLPGGQRLLTHALLEGSPAINAGNLNAKAGFEGVPRYDQRGEKFQRIFGERIDVGAFEYQSPSDLKLVVDTLADEVDGDYGPGDVSLREAIGLANQRSSDDTIRFSPKLAGGTIRLTLGELRITDDVVIVGLGAERLTIDASGNDPTPDIDDGKGSRIFNVDNESFFNPIKVSFSGLRLTGGDSNGLGGAILSTEGLNLDSVIIQGNSAREAGGGIYQLNGELSARAVRVVGNRAGRGGGINASATTSFEDSVIAENTANSAGGGILNAGGRLSVSRTRVSGNSATEPTSTGGGIFQMSRGSTSLVECEVLSNSAAKGGGVYLDGSATIERSVFSSNVAAGSGGGLYLSGVTAQIADSTISGNTSSGNGGGIARYTTIARGTELLAVNTTVSGNRSNGNGGGVFLQAPSTAKTVLFQCTITENMANRDRLDGGSGGGVFVAQGTVQIDHTIVAGNADQSTIAPDITGFLGAVLTPRYSLIGTNSGSGLTPAPVNSPDANGNLIGGATTVTRINPQLAPLADNGGPTKTHALLSISPAINRGDPAALPGIVGVPTSDQRGAPYKRVYGERIDIGAFERQPFPQLLGDFDGSGAVDNADYVLWRQAAGRSGEIAQLVDSRGNGDGQVDQWDRAVWLANFGQTDAALRTAAGTAPALAEPTADSGPAVVDRVLGPIEVNSAPNAAAETNLNRPLHRPAVRTSFAHDTALLALLRDQSAAARQSAAEFTGAAGNGNNNAAWLQDGSDQHDAAIDAVINELFAAATDAPSKLGR